MYLKKKNLDKSEQIKASALSCYRGERNKNWIRKIEFKYGCQNVRFIAAVPYPIQPPPIIALNNCAFCFSLLGAWTYAFCVCLKSLRRGRKTS